MQQTQTRPAIFNSFIDLNKSLQKQTIIDGLQKLHGDSILELAIKEGLKRPPYNEIIITIKEQAQDNKTLVSDVIGKDLLNQILNY